MLNDARDDQSSPLRARSCRWLSCLNCSAGHAGELPIEMVPACDAGPLRRVQCQESTVNDGSSDRRCTARSARGALARRSLADFSAGVAVWVGMVLASLLCLLGLVGCHKTIRR